MNAVRRKYVPDLAEFMAQCEQNYALLLRLLRAAEKQPVASGTGDYLQRLIKANNDDSIRLPFYLSIVDEARYTTTLIISVELSSSEWVSPVKLKVRLYHDAQLAEVMEPNRNHAPKHQHPYPKQVKHYPDDKVQRNQLLSQCLSQCFQQNVDKVAMPVIIDSGDCSE